MNKPDSIRQQPSAIWIILILLISFWLRLHALLELPGFVDEGNHLRWASEVWEGRWVFPLASGKPLLIYWEALFFPFPSALWLGRAASVLTGVVILSGLYALGRKWNAQTGFFAALCYALMPWTFFHERLAVADSLVAACAVVMMVAAFQHVKRPSLITTIVLAISLIALPLAKLSAGTLLIMPLVVAWFYSPLPTSSRLSAAGEGLGVREKFKNLFLPYLLTTLVLAILLGYANLRYSVAQEVTMRVGFGQRTLLEWWIGNAKDVFDWGLTNTLLVSILIVSGVVFALWRHKPLDIIFLIGFFISLGTYVFAPSTAYPRYYLPTLLFGSMLAGSDYWDDLISLPKYAADRNSRRARMYIIFGLPLILLAQYMFFFGQAYLEPLKLPLPLVDRQQHMSLWSSGYGIREGMMFLSDESKKESEPSIVYVSDLAGMVTARLYWTGNGKVLTLWDATMGASVEEVEQRTASGKPTFLLVDTDHFKANFVGLNVNPYELGRFRRPFDGQPIIVYRLKPESFQFPKE